MRSKPEWSISRLVDAKPDPSWIGPKAAALARLAASRVVDVPPSWVLDLGVFLAGLRALDIHAVSVDEARARLELATPPSDLIELLNSMPRSAFPLAVRSSSITEDTDFQSAAGHYTTVLGAMTPEKAAADVLQCWLSAFAAPSLFQRNRESMSAMAVLIQPLLHAQASGVCFSRDPLDRTGHTLVLEATKGLCAPLVSGEVTPDRFVFDRQTMKLLDQSISRKSVILEATAEGVVRSEPLSESGGEPAISLAKAVAVAQTARACEEVFGVPQDVEWLWEREQLWVVQSRPIVVFLRTASPRVVAGSS